MEKAKALPTYSFARTKDGTLSSGNLFKKRYNGTQEKGLYANIHGAKRRRIKKGSGEKMRKPGTKALPTRKQPFNLKAAKTAKAN